MPIVSLFSPSCDQQNLIAKQLTFGCCNARDISSRDFTSYMFIGNQSGPSFVSFQAELGRVICAKCPFVFRALLLHQRQMVVAGSASSLILVLFIYLIK